ncbi:MULTISPECIES: copper amine oxidase N-terminal domain-containing protein [unclassified Paenibacillus]|uniref:copper amine oxidase N-terminal domain-containing protein n=1 Tax=unclassified Paenibacillus TaxID=185978 RepID=UPI00362D5161
MKSRMPRTTMMIITALLLLMFAWQAVAASKPVNVYYNDVPLEFEDAPPVIVDGTTLVPFRALFEALGFRVKWIDSDGIKQAIGTMDGLTIQLTINSKAAKVNDVAVPLEVPAQILNGKTMVPLRFVSENSGYDVSFVDKGSEYVINVLHGGLAPAKEASMSVEPWVVKGVVVDGQGKPLPGAQIFADNTLVYNSNLIAITEADGSYRIQLPKLATTWQMSGNITRKQNSNTFEIDLTPDNDNPFAGNTGAIRNFQWNSTAARPEGCFSCSGKVLFTTELIHPDDPTLVPPEREDVKLTLVPQGPLLDGSAGKTISAHGENSPDGFGLQDVPFTRYKITALYEPKNDKPRAMLIRINGKGEYTDSLVTDFQSLMTGIYHIELEVKLAPKKP